MEKCLQIMCTKTIDVVQDSSFEDVELSTIITILDQDVLNIDSELNLFWAINKYAEKHGLCASRNSDSSQSNNDQDPVDSPQSPPTVDVEAGPSNVQRAVGNPSMPLGNDQQAAPIPLINTNRQQELPTIRDAIRRIRFLSLNPQQFAEGPARTNLLTQSEAFAILMNISTSNSCYPMPEGFTTNKNPRNAFSDSTPASPMAGPSGNAPPMGHRPGTSGGPSGLFTQHVPPPQPAPLPSQTVPAPAPAPVPAAHPGSPQSPDFYPDYLDELRANDSNYDRKYYCRRIMRQQTECLNTSVLDCSLTFIVDRSVCITGIEVPSQVQGSSIVGNDRYSELLYAHLLDAHGSRLTYTHCNQRVQYNSMLEIAFDRPVFIQRHKMYKIGVVFNKVGWYPVSQSVAKVNCDNVCFTFCVGSQSESVRDGLIRTIVFTYTRDGIAYP